MLVYGLNGIVDENRVCKDIASVRESDQLAIVITDDSDIAGIFVGICCCKANKIVLIDCTEKVNTACIVSLLVSKGIYNIYNADIDVMDEEYIEMVEDRECTKEEAEIFVKHKIEDAERAEVKISELEQIMYQDKTEAVLAIIKESKEDILRALENVKVYKNAFNKLAEALKESRNCTTEISLEKVEENKENESSESEILELKERIDNMTKEADSLQQELGRYKSEVLRLRDDNRDLVRKVNDKAPIITVVEPIILSTIKRKTRNILYIKELSYVPYTNTVISIIADVMDRLLKQIDNNSPNIKCKLVICDDKSEFSLTYDKVLSVGGEDYVSKKDKVIGLDSKSARKIVIRDDVSAILEDILRQELELVIIYDRLKMRNDLVKGGDVARLWVINSLKGIKLAKEIDDNITYKNVITRPGVYPGTIGLAEIKEFREDTPNAKVNKIVRLVNFNSTDEQPTTVMKEIVKELPNIKW